MKHNWEYKTWNEVIKIFNGKNQKIVENPNGIYPIYGSGGIMSYANDYICPENCTIIGRKGNINKPIFVSTKFWIVDTAFGLCPNNLITPRFLYYYCVIYDFEKHNKATTIPSLVKNDLLKISMPIPPMEVQEQIVAELDKINEVIADCRELLRTLDSLAQSLFYDYFGDPVTNPKGWKSAKIEDVCTLKSGDSSANKLPKGKIPYVKVGDMNLPENHFGIITSSNFVDLGNQHKMLFPIGTTIFPKRGGAILTNKKKITKVPICCDLNVMGAIPNQVHPIYLYYFFILKDFADLVDGSTVPQINNSDIYPLPILVPSNSLQEEFASRIEKIEEQKKAVEETISTLQILLDMTLINI